MSWDREQAARLAAESRARARSAECRRDHFAYWVVVQRRCNYSAFSGYHWTPSEYSGLRCEAPGCGRAWRTRAAYVDRVPDAAGRAR